MPETDEEEDTIVLGAELEPEPFDDGPDLGPDERDRDLMDGSWEARYYAGREHQRDWSTLQLGLGLLVVLGLVIPGLLVFLR